MQGRNRMDFVRPADGRGGRLRQSEVAHLSGTNQFRHRAHGFFDRHIGIDAVLIIQIDSFRTQPFQAGVTARADIFRPPVDAARCGICPVSHNPELGGQKNLVTQTPDRLANQHFVVTVAVNVRRIQKGDAQLDGAVNGGRRFRIVPRSIELGHPHAAQAHGRKEWPVFPQLTLLH